MSNTNCKGCSASNQCTIDDTSKCPCQRCLIKMVCIDPCEDMNKQVKLNFFMKQVRD